jgi:hypothetical protein
MIALTTVQIQILTVYFLKISHLLAYSVALVRIQCHPPVSLWDLLLVIFWKILLFFCGRRSECHVSLHINTTVNSSDSLVGKPLEGWTVKLSSFKHVSVLIPMFTFVNTWFKLNCDLLRKTLTSCSLHFEWDQPTPWLWSASELYRPSYRRLSPKLVATFGDRRVSHGQWGGSPTVVISIFQTGLH